MQSNELASYNKRRLQITLMDMLTLGGWAVGNMAEKGGFVGNSSASYYYFHPMNVFRTLMNLG